MSAPTKELGFGRSTAVVKLEFAVAVNATPVVNAPLDAPLVGR